MSGVVAVGGDWGSTPDDGGFTVVRAWTGGGWRDITANLNQLIRDNAYDSILEDSTNYLYYVTDVIEWQGRLLALVRYGYRSYNPSLLVELDGGIWRVLDDSRYHDQYRETWRMSWGDFNGFVMHGNQLYIQGYAMDPARPRGWSLSRVDGGTITSVFQDGRGGRQVLRMDSAFPNGVLLSPTNPDHLILGDAYEDDWGWYDFATNQVTMGSNPGGSCIFAMGVDNGGTVWSGDFADYYYYSTDGGHTFADALRGQFLDPGYPEIWQFLHFKGEFYGVGCGPYAGNANNGIPRMQLVRRRPTPVSASLPATWEIVADLQAPVRTGNSTDGVGFQAAVGITDNYMLIGCGGEPFYYERDGSAVASVYRWDGVDSHLPVDVGGGLNWGMGCYLLRPAGIDSPWLRMTQRNDGLGRNPHPRLGHTSTSIGSPGISPRIGHTARYD